MKKDFTVKVYVKLLEALRNEGFFFRTFEEFVASAEKDKKVVVLRHDVDKLPLNSLRFAEIEASMGIKATYYFRMVKGVYDERVIKRIGEMGHEIGYHYECLSQALVNVEFRMYNLELKKKKNEPLRTLKPLKKNDVQCTMYDVGCANNVELEKKKKDNRIENGKTVNGEQGTVNSEKGEENDSHRKTPGKDNVECRMYNLELEKKEKEDPQICTNKRSQIARLKEERLLELGIRDFEENLMKLRGVVPIKTIAMHGSPLSSVDNKMLWGKYDYRDYGLIGEPYFDVDYHKVLYLTDTGRGWNNKDASIRDKVEGSLTLDVKSTFDLIKAIEKGLPANQVIINTHPQRWSDEWFAWGKELVMQNLKNVVKRRLAKGRFASV